MQHAAQSPAGPVPEGTPTRRNIQTIVELEERTRARRTRGERVVDATASWAASGSFILLHAAFFTAWLAWNVNPVRAFDPFPFSLLTVVVSLEAILLTGFVLTQQARMRAEADRRAHLDLQVNVVAEQELTAILRVLCRLAERSGVDLKQCGSDLELLLAPTDLKKLTETLEHEMNAGERIAPRSDRRDVRAACRPSGLDDAETAVDMARKHGTRNHADKRSRSVRYAVVGLGHIAQIAVLPAFAHASRNSRLTALVSRDPAKLKTLSRKYGVSATFSYSEYEACLEQVDAVYLALPNSLHAEYAVRAAQAGVHVLCEKPLAVTVADCERMIEACRAHDVKLMTAYRLHFEEANLRVVDLVRRGRIGDPKFFTSSFSMHVRPGNIRTKRSLGGGTLYDIGVYCINAARYLFRAEPLEVTAVSVNSGVAALSDIDESTGALLRFDGARVAAFVTSFNAASVGSYRIVGTKGQIHVDPAFEYAEGLSYELTVGDKTIRKRIGRRDQFAAELLYFSDCVLKGRAPEPSGEDGLQDVRIIQALYESAETGKTVAIPPYREVKRPDGRQRISRPPVKKPDLVHVKSANTD